MADRFEVHDLNIDERFIEIEYLADAYGQTAISWGRAMAKDMNILSSIPPKYPDYGIRVRLTNLGARMLFGEGASQNLLGYIADIWKILKHKAASAIQQDAINPSNIEGQVFNLPN